MMYCDQSKRPGIAAGPFLLLCSERLDLEVHTTHAAAPGGVPPPPAFFFGTSATMASVVIKRAATDAAFWIAARTTLVGSMMPLATRSTYSPVCASQP